MNDVTSFATVAVLQESHPASARARIVRMLRPLRYVRGWPRVAGWLVPPDLSGPFVVSNRGILFAGDLRSYIDRQTYLFGQYEE
jgi:hypothetical protein